VLYEIARDLLRLLAPVMTFTAEEAWQLLPGDKAESVFLAGFPSAPARQANPELLSAYDRLFEVRSETQKLLEAARRDKLIGSSLEAQVQFSAKGPALELLRRYQADLPTLLIVSQVGVSPEDVPGAQPLALTGEAWRGSKVRAAVKRALGEKCPRCWTYNEGLAPGGVCDKCTEAIGP